MTRSRRRGGGLVYGTGSTAAQVRDDLQTYIDANDGLFVGALSGATAWKDKASETFLHSKFGEG